MKAFITCRQGFEIFAAKELEAMAFQEILVKKGYVLFSSKNIEDLLVFLYKSGISIRGGIYLGEAKIGNQLESSKKALEELSRNIGYEKYIDNEAVFRLECIRKGEHDFKSNEIERMLGGFIFDSLDAKSLNPKVDLHDPDINFYTHILDDNLLLGIDLVGFDMNKRDYKLFTNSHSIKGDIGRAMLLMGTENLKKGVILDPFSSDGVIGIEAALHMSNKSHNHYRKKEFLFKKQKIKQLEGLDIDGLLKVEDNKEKESINFNINCFDPLFHNIKSIQKNSKIAGIDKAINVSRIEPENIDLKFEDRSLDLMITVLMTKSKSIQENRLKRYIESFFERAKQLMKKKGKIIIFADVNEYDDIIEKYGLKMIREIDIGIESKRIFELSV